ncbi:MAG: helix-turn-helix domain-containing protein [Lachnospiraceae bacterium]|nr:helix-turn-helix domain-containing protein [Lachnospiraceae bacterium]
MDLRESTKAYLAANGIKREAVARYIGISKHHFYHWINGDYDLPSWHLESIRKFINGAAYKSIDEIKKETK